MLFWPTMRRSDRGIVDRLSDWASRPTSNDYEYKCRCGSTEFRMSERLGPELFAKFSARLNRDLHCCGTGGFVVDSDYREAE